MTYRKAIAFCICSLISLIGSVFVVLWWYNVRAWDSLVAMILAFGTAAWSFYNTDWRLLLTGLLRVDPEVTQREREHDIATFRKVDAIFPEELVLTIEDYAVRCQFVRISYVEQGDKLHDFFSVQGNHFIDPVLRSTALAFNYAVSELHHFTGMNTRMTAADVASLNPELREKLHETSMSDPIRIRWNKLAAELERLAGNMVGAHTTFRNEVKNRLQI